MTTITDITHEYTNNANPQSGNIRYEAGYRETTHKEEISVAKWLIENFGGDMTLLRENIVYGIKTPDYLWCGTTWELKTISSDKYDTIDKRIRKAYEQIRESPRRENRGGIVLDFTGSNLPMEKIKKYIMKSAGMRAHGTIDVIAKKGGKYIVLRVKKE